MKFWVLTIFACLLFWMQDSWGALWLFLIFGGLGMGGVLLFCKGDGRKDSLQIGWIMTLVYVSYCFLKDIYCMYTGLRYIGSIDGLEYYLPCAMRLIDVGSLKDFFDIINNEALYHGGGWIWVYFVPVVKLAVDWLQVDPGLAVQMSLIPFAVWICVVVYHLLVAVEVPREDSYRYSLIFGTVTALFWLSSFIVRDLPINLAYAILIYLIFADHSTIKKWIIGGICVAVAMSLRYASGIASVPLLLLALYGVRGNRFVRGLGVCCIVGCLLASSFSAAWREEAEDVAETYLAIEMRDQLGNSTLSSFNRLPWGLSHLAKTVYSQFHPFPAWRNMTAGSADLAYAYNVTKFPDIWCVFFRIMGLLILVWGMLDAKAREKLFQNTVLLYTVCYAVLLLLVQSMTIEERRKMSVYPAIFMLIVLFWQECPPETRKFLVFCTIGVFAALQLLGFGRVLMTAL